MTYIEEWLNTYKSNTVKYSTYSRLVTCAKLLSGYSIAQMPICDITALHIQQYVNEISHNGYKLSSLKQQMRIVTAPLRLAAALHQIPANPAIGIKLPQYGKPDSPEAYTAEEQTALRRVLNTNERRGYAAIALMLETGLRPGEALALRWACVDIPRKRLTVRATVVNPANRKQSFVQESAKSDSSNRTIPLTPAAIGLLERLYAERSTEWVFETDCTERLSYEALRGQTRRACEAAGIPYRGLHIFRHTFATNCYHKGIDVKILSRLLGHSDVTTTYNIYVHLYGDGFDEMYNALVK